MNFFRFLLCITALTMGYCNANTDYRVMNAINKNISVKIESPVDNQVGAFDLKPGEVKTVTTNLANCLDRVMIDTHDGKGFQNIGAGVCAGSIACITDEANYNHVLAKPYYGQMGKEIPCDPSKLGVAVGAPTGVAAGAAGAGIAASAISGASVAGSIVGSAAGGLIAAAAGEAALAAVPPAAAAVAGVAAAALVGCGAADLAVLSGFCVGSAGKFSAEDWQDPESTQEARIKAKNAIQLQKDAQQKIINKVQTAEKRSNDKAQEALRRAF